MYRLCLRYQVTRAKSWQYTMYLELMFSLIPTTYYTYVKWFVLPKNTPSYEWCVWQGPLIQSTTLVIIAVPCLGGHNTLQNHANNLSPWSSQETLNVLITTIALTSCTITHAHWSISILASMATVC